MSVFEPLIQVTGRPLILQGEDIDTDQILPAKFLSHTTRDGLGHYAFYDWRNDKIGAKRSDHILNRTAPIDRRILVVGRNFGCGSSREHAPWALYDYGVRVILGESLADIFRSNCLKNGIAAVSLTAKDMQAIAEDKNSKLLIDLERSSIKRDGAKIAYFELDALSRRCLMTGQDQLAILLDGRKDVLAYEARRGSSQTRIEFS